MSLQQQIDATGDPALIALRHEAGGYPHQADESHQHTHQLVIPLVLQTPGGVMRFYTTTMVFGSPVDVTLSELAIETFLPADPATEAAMRR